jgi:predicted chitinase
MRADEIQPNKLVIFDIDDTLVKTDTKVNVVKDGKIVNQLNSHDFSEYQLQPGEEFDFGRFRDAREFFEKAKPILPMINQLKHDIATGNKVIMVTARSDFNDREIFLDTFRRFGIDMSKVHVYRAGNIKDNLPTEVKKKAIIRKVLDANDYNKAIMYDDVMPNLDLFLSLKDAHPGVKFYAWYVNPKGEAEEYGRSDLEEGWKDWVAGAAMGAAALGGGNVDAKQMQPQQKPAIVQPAQKAEVTYNALSNNPQNEIALLKAAKKSGMKGTELAQFMAQTKHESWDFERLKEKPQPGVKDYYNKKYDIKYSPKTAKILGNKHAGDGARYHGRGFIQLTGRDNYRMAGQALGIDLLNHPDLASKPDVAAQIAVWYWNTRVKPGIQNFADTRAVTQKINPAAKGLENRHENFKDYLRIV